MENESCELPSVWSSSLLGDHYVSLEAGNHYLPEENRLRDDVSESNKGYDFCYHNGYKFFTCVCGLLSVGSIMYAAYLFKCGEDSSVSHVITEAILCGVLTVCGLVHWCKSEAVNGSSSLWLSDMSFKGNGSLVTFST